MDLKIAEHRCRVVETTGDGMLVEFASVVDAVRCAIEIRCAGRQALPLIIFHYQNQPARKGKDSSCGSRCDRELSVSLLWFAFGS